MGDHLQKTIIRDAIENTKYSTVWSALTVKGNREENTGEDAERDVHGNLGVCNYVCFTLLAGFYEAAEKH